MTKVDVTVRRETGYIAACVAIFSALMEAIFLVLGYWDYTVLLGNLLSGGVAVLNFFLMGLSVQEATGKDEKGARSFMQMSQSLRSVLLFAAAVLGVLLPCFHTVTALVPLFFPRIGVTFRPLLERKAAAADDREKEASE